MSVQVVRVGQLRSTMGRLGDLVSCSGPVPDLLPYILHRPLLWPQTPCYKRRSVEEVIFEGPSISDKLQFLIY